MKSRKFLALVAFLTVSAALLSTPVFAKPIVNSYAGTTRVQFDSAFTSTLDTLGVQLGSQFPAQVRNDATFPVASGQVDLESLKGEIVHSGGVSLSSGGITVSLSDFVIDTTGKCPVVTALVSTNESIVGRIPLFNVDLAQKPEVKGFGFIGSLRIEHAGLKLTSKAATVLNLAFDVTAFNSELPVGTAKANVFTYNPSFKH